MDQMRWPRKWCQCTNQFKKCNAFEAIDIGGSL